MRTLIILLAATLITGSAVYGAGTWGKTGNVPTTPTGPAFGGYSSRTNAAISGKASNTLFAAYTSSYKKRSLAWKNISSAVRAGGVTIP